MARPLRIQFPGAFYHVMNRGSDRKPIFFDPVQDRRLFTETLADTVRLWKIKVHAYSLMDNHYHLLIETPLANISRAMRHLDGVYTQRINRNRQKDGALFRGRFKSILVQKDAYFVELLRYIHLNGVRAGLFSRPQDDPYCSHQFYVGRPPPPWLTVSLGLSFFNDKEAVSSALFQAHVDAGVNRQLEAQLARNRWPAILGSSEFIETVKAAFDLASPPHDQKPQERELVGPAIDPEKILEAVRTKFGLMENELARKHGRSNSSARQIAALLLRYRGLLSMPEIGRRLGGIKTPAVSWGIQQAWRNKDMPSVTLKKEFGLADYRISKI